MGCPSLVILTLILIIVHPNLKWHTLSFSRSKLLYPKCVPGAQYSVNEQSVLLSYNMGIQVSQWNFPAQCMTLFHGYL